MKREGELPTAESIIAKFVQVTGGRSAYEKTKSMSTQGSLAIPQAGMKGTVQFTFAEGGRWRVESDLGAAGSDKSGCDGRAAWAQAGKSTPRKLEGNELLQAQQEADLQARLHSDKYYATMQTKGRDAIDGEDCYRVELTSLAGDVTVEYFSIDSGYLVRRISKLAAPAGKIQITEDFDD